VRSRHVVVLLVALLFATACQNAGAPATSAPGATGTAAAASPTDNPKDMLAKIKAAGVIRVGTDPNYAPQSFLKPDGSFDGFDIDTANEIGKRLGVTVKFETPDFSIVEAGSWAGRFDISVGSVTITEKRKTVLDFTQPYYYTPAQMGATKASGITTLEGLAGKTVCVGEGTTYFQWLTGALALSNAPPPATPPAGVKATTLKTDQDCAQSARAGRRDFEGFLTSSTTLDAAIKAGSPLVKVGDPVFFEALAVAIDKKAAPNAELLAALDKAIGDMHADGTLTNFSKKWFDGLDLTKTTT
jgi:polar amino acid transport system substrate-binding protein